MFFTLEKAERGDYAGIERIFDEAFPPEERPPFSTLRESAEKGSGIMLAAKDGGSLAGFIFFVTDFDLMYLFFFAVDRMFRGRGYGTRILEKLKERYPDYRIFLAREPMDRAADNYDQRVRRRDFYMRSGFRDIPLRVIEKDYLFECMSNSGDVAPEEYLNLMRRWGGARELKLRAFVGADG